MLSLIALLNLFNNAQAALIADLQQGVAHYADNVTGSNGDFFDQTFTGDFSSPTDATQLSAAVTGDDLTSYARTFDANLSTDPGYINNSYIDLGFGATINFFNGDGADLVLFFAGNATKFKDGHIENYLFSFEIGNFKSDLLGVTTDYTSDIYGIDFPASYALIDLNDFGFAANASAEHIRIFLGDSSMPALAGVGALNATVVPLPLSSILFSSGLALLTLFRRKKSV